MDRPPATFQGLRALLANEEVYLASLKKADEEKPEESQRALSYEAKVVVPLRVMFRAQQLGRLAELRLHRATTHRKLAELYDALAKNDEDIAKIEGELAVLKSCCH
jgi:hypothetical protein